MARAFHIRDILAESVGKQIRTARLGAGLTQDQLALCVRVTKHYLSHIENGRADPSLSLLRLIAKFTRANLKILLFRTGE